MNSCILHSFKVKADISTLLNSLCSCLHVVFGPHNHFCLPDLTYDRKNLKFYLIFFVVFLGMIGPILSYCSRGNLREDNFFMLFDCEGRSCNS